MVRAHHAIRASRAIGQFFFSIDFHIVDNVTPPLFHPSDMLKVQKRNPVEDLYTRFCLCLLVSVWFVTIHNLHIIQICNLMHDRKTNTILAGTIPAMTTISRENPHCGDGCDSWTSHSLRKGAATSAYSVGVPVDRVRFLGGWVPESKAVWTYIDLMAPPTSAALFYWRGLTPSYLSGKPCVDNVIQGADIGYIG